MLAAGAAKDATTMTGEDRARQEGHADGLRLALSLLEGGG